MSPVRSHRVLLAAFSILCALNPEPAMTLDWTEQHQSNLQCVVIYDTALALVADAHNELIFSSTDMSPDGWINPGVVAIARQRVSDEVANFQRAWQFTKNNGVIEPNACRDLAHDFVVQSVSYVRAVLEDGTPNPN